MWSHILYQVFYGISICIICKRYLIRKMLPGEEKLAYSLRCFIRQTHDSLFCFAKYYMLLTVHLIMVLGKWPTSCTILFLRIYFNSLHVSCKPMLIIRRINCIKTTFQQSSNDKNHITILLYKSHFKHFNEFYHP